MIELTKLTGETFFVNPEAVKFAEDCGDTVITMMTGERVMIRESAGEVRRLFIEYKRLVHSSVPFEEGEVCGSVEMEF